MTSTSTLTSKNQTTIPKAVIDALGMKPGDKLVYENENGRFILRAKTGRLADLAGAFAHFGKRPRRPISIEALNAAIGDGYAEHAMRGAQRKSRR